MRTRAQDDADYGDGARLSLHVGVHVSADTTVEVTTYPDKGRATIDVGGYRGSAVVTLFMGTPELRQLRDLLTDTLTTLTAAAEADADPASGADGAVTARAA